MPFLFRGGLFLLINFFPPPALSGSGLAGQGLASSSQPGASGSPFIFHPYGTTVGSGVSMAENVNYGG